MDVAYFAIFFTISLMFCFYLQRAALKGYLTEALTGHLMVVFCFLYVYLSIVITFYLKTNFLVSFYVNIFAMAFLCKFISYAHVMNYVRGVLASLKLGKKDEDIEHVSAQVSL